jgi:tetratricopeptide (TPR) repeat protein
MTREERTEKKEESKSPVRSLIIPAADPLANLAPHSPLPTPHSLFLCYLLFVICYLFSACSSRPKISGDVFDIRNDAEVQLEQGNAQADRGNFTTALVFINQANRLAIITDNPSLLIRSGLTLGNVLFALGNTEDAFEAWNKALEEAGLTGNGELIAVSRVHIARGKLLTQGAAQSVRDEAERNLPLIRSVQYIAFAWTVIGLAEKELGSYAAAEEAVLRALAIHERIPSLELAAYDWFMIASFRSLSGDSNGALKALGNALEYDRRTENSWGLANDWQAFGDVYKKAGNTAAARSAYLRSASIFRALGNNEDAERVLLRGGVGVGSRE